MGIQKITERREVAETGRSYRTAVRAPDLSSASTSIPGSLGTALGGLDDGLKGIGVAIQLKDEADANAAARDIRGYSDHVLNVGYRDPETGAQVKALRTRTGDDLIGVAETHDQVVQGFATKRLENLSDRARRLVSEKTHEYRTSTFHQLTAWSRNQYAKWSIDKAQNEYIEDEDNLIGRMLAARDGAELPDAAKWIGDNAVAAAETGDKSSTGRTQAAISEAAKRDNEEAGQDFDRFTGDLKRASEELYGKYVNYGLVDPVDARNRIRAIQKKTVERALKAYLDNGHFDRASYFLKRGEELGLSADEIKAGERSVLAAATKKRDEMIARAEAEKRRAREESYRTYWTAVNTMYKEGKFNPETISQMKKTLADSIEADFPQLAAKERAQAKEIDDQVNASREEELFDAERMAMLDLFKNETDEMIANGRKDEAHNPDRIRRWADRFQKYDPKLADRLRKIASEKRLQRMDQQDLIEVANTATGESRKAAEQELHRRRKSNEESVRRAEIEYQVAVSEHPGDYQLQQDKKEAWLLTFSKARIGNGLDAGFEAAHMKRIESNEDLELDRAMGLFYSNFIRRDGDKDVPGLITADDVKSEKGTVRLTSWTFAEHDDHSKEVPLTLTFDELYQIGEKVRSTLKNLENWQSKPEVVRALFTDAKERAFEKGLKVDVVSKMFSDIIFEQTAERKAARMPKNGSGPLTLDQVIRFADGQGPVVPKK